jgi:hypothetical protein
VGRHERQRAHRRHRLHGNVRILTGAIPVAIPAKTITVFSGASSVGAKRELAPNQMAAGIK